MKLVLPKFVSILGRSSTLRVSLTWYQVQAKQAHNNLIKNLMEQSKIPDTVVVPLMI